jgi:hypothetical protein
MDEPKRPPEYVTNKLTQASSPLLMVLHGPGPFQLPRLGNDVSILGLESGAIEIRLETERGQAVRLVGLSHFAMGLCRRESAI